MLKHLHSKALENFKTGLETSLKKGEGFAASVRASKEYCILEFDQGCADAFVQLAGWDASKIKEKLQRDIDAHASSVCSAQLSELIVNYEKQLSTALTEPLESLLESGGRDTWASIRKLLKRETEAALLEFSSAVAGFELDEAKITAMEQKIRDYARNVVERKAREEAGKVLIHMKDRFSMVFNHDSDSIPRVWTGKEDIKTITKDARSASLKLLSVMAAIRLDEKPDKIEKILFSSLMDETVALPYSENKSIATSSDPLASSTWEEVPPKDTLITPVQCKSLWKQFKAETEYTITQAISLQEAHRQNNNWLPPTWAIVAMIILGFNELMLVLRNPLYLIILFVVYLLSRAIWVQLNVDGELRHGTLAALLSVSSRFLPTVMNILRQLAEAAGGPPAPQAPQQSQSVVSQSFRNQTPQLNPIPNWISESSVSSNISSNDDGVEYSSPNLIHRRTTNIQEAGNST